ncbi:G protein-coupled receptor [Caenorhabditis elegans]|uniref:G protein-coupled receptor n=1 Tax=Caenorhabditis elegans TaxID=6239 RepID=Q9GZD6_CAEEL|nr:G protein-coupled receptor [Caenorhabditis elegans]CCD63012.1 G protein-coupled receptor [Caenorhabditis elegans]|eukprot:NP_504364.2 Uncharacterized protein CELE_C04F5.2 [Caenorhabditis elegans]
MYSVHATSVMASSSLNCTSVMLRNHFIVAVNVDKIAQISIGLYYALLILVESSLFFLLLTVHFKIRRGSHPFFGLLFGCVLLCYIICGVAEAVCQFLFLFGGSSDTLSVVYLIYDLAYAATTALVFCCLIELPNVCHRIRPIARIQQSRESMIQNVFGKELNVVPTQAEYFAKLQNEWK